MYDDGKTVLFSLESHNAFRNAPGWVAFKSLRKRGLLLAQTVRLVFDQARLRSVAELLWCAQADGAPEYLLILNSLRLPIITKVKQTYVQMHHGSGSAGNMRFVPISSLNILFQNVDNDWSLKRISVWAIA